MYKRVGRRLTFSGTWRTRPSRCRTCRFSCPFRWPPGVCAPSANRCARKRIRATRCAGRRSCRCICDAVCDPGSKRTNSSARKTRRFIHKYTVAISIWSNSTNVFKRQRVLRFNAFFFFLDSEQRKEAIGSVRARVCFIGSTYTFLR